MALLPSTQKLLSLEEGIMWSVNPHIILLNFISFLSNSLINDIIYAIDVDLYFQLQGNGIYQYQD